VRSYRLTIAERALRERVADERDALSVTS